jgi:hypothetical protein
MILETLVSIFYNVITTAFSVIPNAPPTPPTLVNASDTIAQYMGAASTYLNYLFGRDFLLIIIPIIIATFTFRHIYHFTMFVLKKVPFINVK